MSLNSNYVSLLSTFTTARFYQAAGVSAFNAPASFGGVVVFMLDGAAQEVDEETIAPTYSLWGNYDADNDTGWRVALKTAQGATPATLAAAPAVLLDVGNDGPAAVQISPNAPRINLVQVNDLLVQTQVENPDWYAGVSYGFNQNI